MRDGPCPYEQTGIFVYGGTILPGIHKEKNLDIVSVFEAVGAHASGQIDEDELTNIEKKAIPEQVRGGMYTAVQCLGNRSTGYELFDSSAQLAVSEEKRVDAKDAGAAVVNLIEKNIKPRDIMTRKAFENAITAVIIAGQQMPCFTSSRWPMPPMSTFLDDFTEIGKRVPVLCDLNRVENIICPTLFELVVCDLFSKLFIRRTPTVTV